MLVGMKAYSFDLRQKILRACDQRLGSQRAMATLFGVSQSFIEKLLRRRRTTGDIAHAPMRAAGGPSATRPPWRTCAGSSMSTPMRRSPNCPRSWRLNTAYA